MSDSLFFGLHLNDWLRLNCCKMDTHSSSGIRWGIVFSFGLWTLWLHRNRVLFRNERVQDNLKPTVLAKAVEFAYIGINEKLNTTHRSIQVRWTKPPLSWQKLNSDGSSIGNPGRAGGGGLIHDDKGVWVKGYARNIGHITSVAAELWALCDGLRLCSALKIPDVIIELDAKLIVDLLQKEEGHQNCIDALVSDFKSELRAIPMVQVQHCYREANICADALARRGALLPQDFVVFLDPPMEVSLLLSLDSAGVAYDRCIPFL